MTFTFDTSEDPALLPLALLRRSATQRTQRSRLQANEPPSKPTRYDARKCVRVRVRACMCVSVRPDGHSRPR